jgi:hypothetical protein
MGYFLTQTIVSQKTPIGQEKKYRGVIVLRLSRNNSQMVTLAAKDWLIFNRTLSMFKKLRDLYREYKPYIRVDLVMYGVLILLIIIYFIVKVAF